MRRNNSTRARRLLAAAIAVLATAPALAAPAASASAPRVAHASASRAGHTTTSRGARATHSWPGNANLLGEQPIDAVKAAVSQAQEHAAIPSSLNAPAPSPEQPYGPGPCTPAFGAGTTFNVCHLGDTASNRVVALFGDSHAWMWIPALQLVASELHFQLVPITKPGCLVWALHQDRPGWPCKTWYSSALPTLKRLHPFATIVSFMTANFPTTQAGRAANLLQAQLEAVPHPVLLADTPSDNWYGETGADAVPSPQQCMATSGANQGACALSETPQMVDSLGRIQQMVNRDRIPAISTLQWFCADLICPTLIDGTVTTDDGSHLTINYSELLAPRLAGRLKPILDHLASH